MDDSYGLTLKFSYLASLSYWPHNQIYTHRQY